MITLKRLTVPALKHLRDVDLWLPRRGATLIEGANESGKSTLFEAIYFALYGRPLVGEEPGKATLSALLPHDGQQAQVKLALMSDATELEVTRTLTRARAGGPASEATLVVRQPRHPEERMSAVSAVNERILVELRGLDGETLRNSCFMEQKGLERLESLRRDEREEAISRLLGLERLVVVERALSPSAEERRQVERLREQARVAGQQRRMREATAHEGVVAERLRAAEMRAWLDQRDTLVARMDALAENELRLTRELADQEALLARLDALRSASARLAEAERQRWRARQATQDTALLTEQLEQLDAVEGASTPEAQRRLEDIQRLESALRALATERAQLAEADVFARRAQAARETELRARQALSEAERGRGSTATALARSQAREVLSDWILARERMDVREGRTQQIAALQTARGRYAREAAETRAQSWQWLALTWASLVMALISAALAIRFSISALWVFVALAGIGAAGLGIRWRMEVSASRAHKWKAIEAEDTISTVHVEANLAQRLRSDELARLEARLRAAGVPIPDSAEAGEALLESLPHEAHGVEVETQARDAEARAAQARLELERALGDADGAYAALRNLGFDADQAPQIQRRLQAIEAEEHELIGEARELSLPDDLAALTAARGAAELTLSKLVESMGSRDELHTRLLESAESLNEVLQSWAYALETVARDLAAQGVIESVTLPDPLETRALEALHERLGEQTQQALAHDDESGARARLSALIAERERLSAQSDETCNDHGQLREQIRARLAELGLTAEGDESLTTLIQSWPLLGDVAADDLEQLRAERDNAHLAAYHTEQVAAESAALLDSAPLDDDDLRARLAAAERDLRVREIACDLASETRARIIRRALPETEIYMRAILPELTAGRYHDVTLLREDSSGAGSETDIAIRMWDQVAGRYVRKNLFSGGARDQASLALRLAFALATLPKELGAIPGFIFLDEPLSAFDEERSLALTRVLTTGAIAEAFAQVFLISHSQVIEPAAFDYHLRMDGGRVVESTLPGGALAQALWDAESEVGANAQISARLSG